MPVPVQQRRQHADPPSPAPGHLPFVEIQGPQKWSWLNDVSGKKRPPGRSSRKTRQRRWRIACFAFGSVFLIWLLIGLYFYYFSSSSTKLDDKIVDPRAKVSGHREDAVWGESKLATKMAPVPPQIIPADHNIAPASNQGLHPPPDPHQERKVPMPEIPADPSQGQHGSPIVARNVMESNAFVPKNVSSRPLHYGPLLGGPVLIRRTIPNVLYPGSSADMMHGKLGITANGMTLWKPHPKPATINNMGQVLREGGGFNLLLSDSLSLDRETPDHRHGACKAVRYDLTKLPEASIIIVFYNEPFSTLMRSVHSVLNRTPSSLLKEIILVDDCSTKPHIVSSAGEPSLLERYVATLPKVRLLRNPTRTGIVGARLLGIENVQADIFVILDSHIEVQPQWLEPLVQRIQEDRRRVVMPQVDGINARTFEYSGGGIGCTLGMIWNLMEHAFSPDKRNPARMNKKVTDFVESPTMAGGLFAAHRDYFMDLGGYDRGMKYWGVENLELSFRLWQCGGVLECSRCSRVYHIFRDGGHGYSIPDPNSLMKNKLRTMSVWMDEYADLAWNVLGRPVVDMGDVSDRVELRKRLECKPFSYFLNEVWPESDVRNLTIDVPYMGRLRNVGSGLCLTSYSARPETDAQLRDCTGSGPGMMFFRRSGRIMPVRNDEACLNRDGGFKWCRQTGMDDARWRISPTGQIVLEEDEVAYTNLIEEDEITKITSRKWCLAVDTQTRRLTTVHCLGQEKFQGALRGPKDVDIDYQVWEWDEYKPPSVWTPPPIQRDND